MGYALTAYPANVDEQRRINTRTWAAMYVGVLGFCAVLGLLALQTAPRPFALPFTMLLLISAVVAVKPIVGIYLVAFFTLFTDVSITPWFPFAKNMSSQESILYVGDQVIISPLEVVLAVTTVAWLLRLLIDRTSTGFVRGRLLAPMLSFTAFLFLGIVFGLATGGDRYVAIWEFRPLLYLPLVYLLLTNLFTTRRHYQRLALVLLVAVLAHTALALQKWAALSGEDRDELESLVDHGSAVQMGAVLMVAIAAWLLPKAPRSVRWFALVASVPVGWVWLISERRAAVVALTVSLIFLGVLLWNLDRRRLRIAGPVFVVLGVAYLTAFWQSESLIGFPAQAIKSVIATEDAADADQSSNLYRDIENFDMTATIQAKPITGFGFGQKFLRPVPLPDLGFPFHEYIPHNSFLWIWIKMGVGGFLAMLFLFGSAIRMGVSAMVRLGRGRDLLLMFAATGYLVMYLVFTYVDIAWDIRSMISVAIAMAVCSELLRCRADPALEDAAVTGRDSMTRPIRAEAPSAN